MGKNKGTKIISVVSALLGVAAVASTIAYFVWHGYTDKMHRERWKDYNDCGLA